MRSVEEILAEDRLWKVGDAARFLGMSTSWVYKETSAGRLPHVTIGASLRFDPEALREYVRSRASGGRAQATVVPLRRG